MNRLPIEHLPLPDFPPPETLARAFSGESRLRLIWEDEEVRRAALAALRTAVNIGISLADVVPALGEFPGWVADAGKVMTAVGRTFGVDLRLDLTPAVSKKVALGSELLEIPTLTVFPPNGIETSLQLKADWPTLQAGFQRAKEIWQNEAIDYAANRAEIDGALEVFDPSTQT